LDARRLKQSELEKARIEGVKKKVDLEAVEK